MKIFLGGTCNESTWRNEIIEYLREAKIDYFNPVVDNWTPECMANEIKEKQACDFCLYTITPKMTGVYSIAEVVDDSNKRPNKTILVLLREDHSGWPRGRLGKLEFTNSQWKSLNSVAEMVRNNGGVVFEDLLSAVNWIRSKEL